MKASSAKLRTAPHLYRVYDTEGLIYIGSTIRFWHRLTEHRRWSWWSSTAVKVRANVIPDVPLMRKLEMDAILTELPRWNIYDQARLIPTWDQAEFAAYIRRRGALGAGSVGERPPTGTRQEVVAGQLYTAATSDTVVNAKRAGDAPPGSKNVTGRPPTAMWPSPCRLPLRLDRFWKASSLKSKTRLRPPGHTREPSQDGRAGPGASCCRRLARPSCRAPTPLTAG